MMKLYILPGANIKHPPIGCPFQLISEEGEFLYSHFCSGSGFAQGDLLLGRPERIKECKEKYGTYELIFFDEQTEMTIEELQKRHNVWEETKKRKEDAGKFGM